MKQRTCTLALILVSTLSIIYTLRIYSMALFQAMSGGLQGPNTYYPWLVLLEAIILLAAGGLPLAAACRPALFQSRWVRWLGGLCLGYGILISINFFVHAHAFNLSNLRVALRLLSWCVIGGFFWLTFKKLNLQELSAAGLK